MGLSSLGPRKTRGFAGRLGARPPTTRRLNFGEANELDRPTLRSLHAAWVFQSGVSTLQTCTTTPSYPSLRPSPVQSPCFLQTNHCKKISALLSRCNSPEFSIHFPPSPSLKTANKMRNFLLFLKILFQRTAHFPGLFLFCNPPTPAATGKVRAFFPADQGHDKSPFSTPLPPPTPTFQKRL